MVLQELGNSIANALSKIQKENKIDEKSFQILLNDISKALMNADVDVQLINTLNQNIKNRVNLSNLPSGIDVRRVIEKAVIQELSNLLESGKKPWTPIRKKLNIVMMVGLQGSGKTTTVTKLANYYKKRDWKVAVVCADTFRAGAFAQLSQNCALINVHFYGDPNQTDPAVLAQKGIETLRNKMKPEIIIVDTSGRHKQESELFEEMTAIYDAIKPDETILVLDSSIGQQARPQTEAFCKYVKVGSVVMTKLDGHAKGGGALAAVAAAKAPITFIGVGENFNNLERFETSRFVNRILGKGDLKSLVETVKEQKLDNQQDLINNIRKGKFTLRMMKDQFDNILKLGSFSQIMSMIPGLNNLPKESEQQSSKRFKNFLTLMDSMTNEELDGDISIIEQSPSRQKRIARGAGVHPAYLQELIQIYKPFAAFALKMKKMPFGKNGELPKNLNPSNMGKLASMIPSQVLKQIGGQNGLMDLMNKFQNAESGGGDPMAALSNMQSMMKGMQNLNKIQRRTRR